MEHITSQFRTLYAHLVHPTDGVYRKQAIRPGADWKIMITVFFVLLLGAISLNIYLYIKIQRGDLWHIDVAPVVQTQVAIHTDVLTRTLADFTHRAETLQSLSTTQSTTTDPSL